MTVEYRFTPFGEDALEGDFSLSGVAMPYGGQAQLPGFRERFLPGAFGNLEGADVVLNLQHQRAQVLARTGGGGLALADSPERLALRAELVPTQLAKDTLELIRAKVLRGLSVEFAVPSGGDRFERANGGTVRIVREARLLAVAVVDTPAYSAAGVASRYADPEVIRRARAVDYWRSPGAFRPWEL